MPDVGLSVHTLIRIWGIISSPTEILNVLVSPLCPSPNEIIELALIPFVTSNNPRKALATSALIPQKD